ncbi:aldo/keto reductase [Desertifilum sp. FACHB-1129]|uniref:Aldo/keto reductase n=1 Tax=Desertifilum tharense IPPAS B-1220 TaxID=1781255 RepID=A0A1E5QJL7_9CYAN|nr:MULTISPECIES: aldo/keto reductase [Desertifilum]MDA0210944.1 aldo/keto reductase [Cyanobacteria bacterium FC1]MBD2313453.1 aldo/keto reductase [Desertifilum sp. FACHB-1129]MBD2322323.1 aldo/keto reductase [Desertifilum sp. FACHB-866]MBD2332485.1 aldo/keto reductase [Desertifilum sp. FACHB-868]OEJ74889.1 aldo/keto reductase [Desertifilum tharense IPPAS B-1220]
MQTLKLPNGDAIPVLGMGTWQMGESGKNRQSEVKALQYGLDLGLSLIDTAEMYGEGGAEEVIAEAIASRRSDVFLVSKVYPHNASKRGAIAACERSLQRLKTDYLDLYLLHWRGSIPLSETLEAFATLQQAGKIRSYGVSNFDLQDMQAAIGLENGSQIATNQVLYNLTRRGIEWDLLPWCRQHSIPVMAYSPIEQGRMLNHRTLNQLAEARGVSAAQIAIAWLLHQDNVIVIPKASRINHVEQNYNALTLQLSPEELATLDSAFPPPSQPTPLEML